MNVNISRRIFHLKYDLLTLRRQLFSHNIHYCGRQEGRFIALTIPGGMYDRFQWRCLCWQDPARVDGEHFDLFLVDGSPARLH